MPVQERDDSRRCHHIGTQYSGRIEADRAPSRGCYRLQVREAGDDFEKRCVGLQRNLSYGCHKTIKKDGIEPDKMAGV